jgi:hypothetical protein
MKKYRKPFLMFLILTLIAGSMSTSLFAWDKWKEDDPTTDQWNAIDLLVVRPLAVAASIVGVGIFTVSLPFTLTVDIFARAGNKPATAVNDSAKMFLLNPLTFSFIREFPDENM